MLLTHLLIYNVNTLYNQSLTGTCMSTKHR